VTNFASITQQEIIRLIASHAPLVVHYLLIKEYGYVLLEDSELSENGAYFIHPIDWPKPDISSAKLCWPAMVKQGLQFIGINGPNDIKYYDVNDKKIKYVECKYYNGLSFYLSREEKYFADKNPNQYEIWLVDKDTKIFCIKDIQNLGELQVVNYKVNLKFQSIAHNITLCSIYYPYFKNMIGMLCQ
jgi:hypothetical protein